MTFFGKPTERKHEEKPLPKSDGRSLEQRAGDFDLRVITTPLVDEKTSTCEIEGVCYDASILKRGGRTQLEAENNLMDYAKTLGVSMLSILKYEPSKLIPNGTMFIAGAYSKKK